MAHKFNPDAPFATILQANPKPGAPCIEQDAVLYDAKYKQVCKKDVYKRLQDSKRVIAPAPVAEVTAEERAAQIIGNIPSPQADARRENAAAAAAEELSEDAELED